MFCGSLGQDAKVVSLLDAVAVWVELSPPGLPPEVAAQLVEERVDRPDYSNTRHIRAVLKGTWGVLVWLHVSFLWCCDM